MSDAFETALARRIWAQRYRYRRGDVCVDGSIAATWCRVARAAASVEGNSAPSWEETFEALLRDFRFLPGGRILASAGTDLRATLLNCFVMDTIEDSMDGIFSALKEGAMTMQQGGGVGYDFSTLRPRGERACATGNVATGPDLQPDAHLQMQAALQPFVDGAISKTINLPTDYPFERYREIFEKAYRLGLKGCTVFRSTPAREGVLSGQPGQATLDAKECCLST